LAGEFDAADFVVLVDVGLLELSPVKAEASAKQMGPANVVLWEETRISKLASLSVVECSKVEEAQS
jgi:hypothetical protein